MVIHFGQAERCLRQKSWKVAFELKNPESRKRHKFFRFVHVTGQEAFERICHIFWCICRSDVNEGGTALIRPSGRRPEGRFYVPRPEDCACNPIGRPSLNKKKNSKSSQPELSGRALCMELCDLWSCLETVKIMYTAQQRTHMDVRARR